jgi:hypothetical protein
VTAPRSAHSVSQRRVALIVERQYQPDLDRCVRAVLALLAPRRSTEDQSPDHDEDGAAEVSADMGSR